MPKQQVIKKSALAPTVLIAGGAGFIGSHLTEALLLKDARVVVLDNFTTGKDIHINSLLENPKLAVFDCDINKGLPLEIESVDYIIHLAGFETYLYSKDDVNLESLLTNAVGTKNLLELAHKSGAKFLLASSINVYQGIMSPLSLDHYFGQTEEEEKKYSLTEAKRFAEALVWEYYKRHHTDVRIVRFPEIYGPRMSFDSSGSLGRHVRDLTEHRNLIVYGEGTEKEYYLYISDAVAGTIKALFNQETEGKIYTLTEPEPYAVLETTYMIKNLANQEVQVQFKPKTDKALTNDLIISDRSTLKDLKWEAKVTLKAGIIKTLNWLGYEANEHSFKPNKLIENKKKEITEKKNLENMENIDSIGNFSETQEEKSKPVENVPFKPKLTLGKLFSKMFPGKEKQTQPKNIKVYVKETKPITQTMPHLVGKLEDKKSRKFPEMNLKKMGLLVTGLFIALMITLTAIPTIQVVAHAKKTKEQLELVPTLLTKMNTDGAIEASNQAFQSSLKTQKAFKKLNWVFSITGNGEMYTSIQSLINSSSYFAKTAYRISKASGPVISLWEVVRPDSKTQLDSKELSNAKTELASAQNQLQLANAEFKNVTILPKTLESKKIAYENALKQTEETLGALTALSSDLPSLIGLQTPRKYLVLLQNSNELRPTGGFIGSYAILEFKEGKISKLIIDDIYNPDGQIDLRNISVPSPAPIAQYLGEKNLHIRNANWNPDFPTSAKDIENLFFKVDGSSFDGVIAIDLFFVQNLLEVTGPIFLTAYNEEITSGNVYERAQFHSEFNYSDGSNQKRSFLTLLGSKLLEKLFALSTENMPKLANEISRALDQKHLIVYTPNTVFNAFLDKKGWDGHIVKTEGDYLYVVNANLGGTKANYYVDQKMEYDVSAKTRDGLLRGQLSLSYKHTGTNSAWPGGPYTNYVRVLTKPGTKLTKAVLVQGTKETDVFNNVVIAKEGTLNSFETSFVLEPKEEITLILGYDLPPELSITKDKMDYQLFWQKQPGTQDDTFTVKIDTPFGVKINQVMPEGKFSDRVVKFEEKLNTDKVFSIHMK